MKNIRIYLPCTAVLLFTVVHILVVQDPTHRYFCLNNNNENEQCRVEDKQNFLVYGLDSSFPSQFFPSIFGENLDEFTQLGTDLEKAASCASGTSGHFVGNPVIFRTFSVKYPALLAVD